jgi:hypothetical protein
MMPLDKGLLVDWLGYAASVLVLISLTMSSITRLRLFSLTGAVCFAVYGALIQSPPIWLVNVAIAVVNIFFLCRMYLQDTYFEFLEIRPSSAFLKVFLGFYADDIRKWYPAFSGSVSDEYFVLLCLRNMAIAGVFVGRKSANSTLLVTIDYVIPQYADRKVGRHLYHGCDRMFVNAGFDRLSVDLASVKDANYFRSMGFEQQESTSTMLVVDLDNRQS